MRPKLDHIAFGVSNLESAIAFYQNILGLELMSKTIDEEQNEAFAYFKLDGGNLELLQQINPVHEFARPTIKPPFCPHLALGTENLDQLVSDLKEKNIDIVKGPLEISGLVKWAYITDPDHNIIEFVQWL